jgi:hypothetical protein
MNKKILFSIVIVIMFVGVLLFFAARKVPLQQAVTPVPPSSYALPGAPQPPFSSPPLARTVGEARENALASTLRDSQGNQIIVDKNGLQEYALAREDHYSISYFGKYDDFLIQIQAPPFDESRKEAELRFLKIINAPADIACQMKVIENTTLSVDPERAGQNFHLSFCR